MDPRRILAAGRALPPEPAHVRSRWEAALEPPVGVGPDGLPLPGMQPQPVVFPPDIYAPAQSQQIYRAAAAAIAGPATWAIPAAIQYQLEAASIARIAVFGVSVVGLVASSQITFRLRQNEQPVDGFGDVTLIPGPAAFYKEGFDVFVRIARGARIDVQITVADAGAYTVGAWYQGWSYPQEIQARYDRGEFR